MGDHVTHGGASVLLENAPNLLSGAVVSSLLAVVTLTVGGLGGVVLGLALSGGSRASRVVAHTLLTPFRLFSLLPAILALLLIHRVVPASSAWLHRVLDALASASAPHVSATEAGILDEIAQRPFASAVVALSIVACARFAESIRRGVRGVPRHHVDVARALGLGRVARLRRVVLPEALHGSAPELTEAVLATIRHTALTFVIGSAGLVGEAWSIAETRGHHAALFCLVIVVYTCVLLLTKGLLHGATRSRPNTG